MPINNINQVMNTSTIYTRTKRNAPAEELPWSKINPYEAEWSVENSITFGNYFAELWSQFASEFLPIILDPSKELVYDNSDAPGKLYYMFFHDLLPMIEKMPEEFVRMVSTNCLIKLMRVSITKMQTLKTPEDRVERAADKRFKHIHLEETIRHYRSKDVFDFEKLLPDLEMYVAEGLKMLLRTYKSEDGKMPLSNMHHMLDLIYPRRFRNDQNLNLARMFAVKHSIPFKEE